MEEITMESLLSEQATLVARSERLTKRENEVEVATQKLRTLLEEFFGDVVLVDRDVLDELNGTLQDAMTHADNARDEASQVYSQADEACRSAESAYDEVKGALDTLEELL